MGDAETKLEPRQLAAIEALLRLSTVREAAKAASVGESTLYRWLSDPAFDAEYNKARGRVLDWVVLDLQAASRKATEALIRNVDCGTPSIEIRAAATLLDMAFRSREFAEMQNRIAALEAIFQQDAPE